MNEEQPPPRLAVIWAPEARTDLRAIVRDAAMQILYCIDRYLVSRKGDVKHLKSPLIGFRLRCGNYRVFFEQQGDHAIHITGVRDRKDAYR